MRLRLQVTSSQEKSQAKEELDESSKGRLTKESAESLEEGKEETKKEEIGGSIGASEIEALRLHT